MKKIYYYREGKRHSSLFRSVIFIKSSGSLWWSKYTLVGTDECGRIMSIRDNVVWKEKKRLESKIRMEEVVML